MNIAELRQEYHDRICSEIIRIKRDSKKGDYPNFADGDNRSSVAIAWAIVNRLSHSKNYKNITGQTAGNRFEHLTKEFLEKAFNLLQHLRPGDWYYTTEHTAISGFYQYDHLTYLQQVISSDKVLGSALGGDYIVKPDIIIGRLPVSDEEINRLGEVVRNDDACVRLSPLRKTNHPDTRPILHASISCKWTIRSDRSQNTRTEALNLVRNRKGHTPHIVTVIAEPLPTRIASLALGTGDLDCVYHFALPELQEAIKGIGNEDQLDMLNIMIDGKRLRDISDLPFDLAT